MRIMKKIHPWKLSHAEVVAFAAANRTMVHREIAAYFGVTQSRISRIMRAAGIASENHRRGRPRKLSHDEVVAFAAENPTMLQDEIAAKFGVAQSRVSTILASAGVSGIRRRRT
jgi:predicted XRE-type DNA-binding protein